MEIIIEFQSEDSYTEEVFTVHTYHRTNIGITFYDRYTDNMYKIRIKNKDKFSFLLNDEELEEYDTCTIKITIQYNNGNIKSDIFKHKDFEMEKGDKYETN